MLHPLVCLRIPPHPASESTTRHISRHSAALGVQVSNGTWDYHPPTALDIPIYFKTTLLQRPAADKVAVLGSKASGEPAQLLGVGAFFAVKQAIKAARQEAGVGAESWFRLDAPATPDKIQLACLTKLP